MTETAVASVIAAVIGAIPPTIVAWLTLRQSRENAKKADALTGKVSEVHALANSNLAAVTSALAIANEKIAGLEKLVAALVPVVKKRR